MVKFRRRGYHAGKHFTGSQPNPANKITEEWPEIGLSHIELLNRIISIPDNDHILSSGKQKT